MKNRSQLTTMILINEEILYNILKCLAEANAPIIFKGALLTKLITKDNKYNISRNTLDLDADWNGELLSMSSLEEYLNDIINSSFPDITLKSFRDYGENKSAGFYIYKNGENVASMDIDMRRNDYFNLYEIDNVNFYGSSISKIYADKIYVLSTDRIFRRTKDMVDLYLLTSVAAINVSEIRKIYKDKKQKAR